MKKFSRVLILTLISCFGFSSTSAHAQTNKPVVQAVLFYSPTCGHCEFVIKETILPLVDKYGDQLQIIAIDVSQPEGEAHFLSAIDKFHLEEAGVPFLVVGNQYLIGSSEIPETFPGLVESYLAKGGVGWPDIPGLTETLTVTESAENPAPTSIPIVRAVLVYQSTCSHCMKIMQEVIPPLMAQYGTQLEIFGIDVSAPEGESLYNAAIEQYQVETLAVPTLILGDQVLIGGTEIEERFPGLIEEYLDQGGADWPAITGLEQAITKAENTSIESQASTETEPTTSASPSTGMQGFLLMNDEPVHWTDRFAQDLAGNTLAVVVLLGMLASAAWTVALFRKTDRKSVKDKVGWAIPLLCIIGIGVASYLAYVETSDVAAVCGPVGDCNTVQQSEYARLFGVLPIGVVGIFGYISILISWSFARYADKRIADIAAIVLFGLAALGMLFSLYLTFLEPFVIGATCAWCLTSALLVTGLMLLSVKPARVALLKHH